jgi:hypothetical protein
MSRTASRGCAPCRCCWSKTVVLLAEDRREAEARPGRKRVEDRGEGAEFCESLFRWWVAGLSVSRIARSSSSKVASSGQPDQDQHKSEARYRTLATSSG